MAVFDECENKCEGFYTCDCMAGWETCEKKNAELKKHGFTQEEIEKAWDNYRENGEI